MAHPFMIASRAPCVLMAFAWLLPIGCSSKSPTMRVRQQSTTADAAQADQTDATTGQADDERGHEQKLNDEQLLAYRMISAAKSGDLQGMNMLLDQGADVNTLAYGGWAPLHAAAAAGELGMVELLLQRGAEINLKSRKDRTPTWEAAYNDRDEVVEYLHEHGGTK